ncbi:putative protein tyrosine phosphatase (Pyp1) [Aspergillus neoniger CBS 115656]|uniref:protein-tyrosine-phosphatase n=1 Tax=Aspergillus neoniger (strain CBS 115656) TaxID=1448310 RepID=A0A318Y447_ASPNB|nr:hypothetical protein BO87DRAFT_215551 [Aspergillus neoniger CBS 115656]PYH28504.1 hypothetical protein BO87DRAFT_215551 [Aspergillus neoniger CBS 115656]
MSAMTGTRSPTSPWPPECQNLQLEGSSTPSALYTLRESQMSPLGHGINPHNSVSERSGPNYFSISVESPGNPRRSRDAISYTQPPVSSPKAQLLSKNKSIEDYLGLPKTGVVADDEHRESPAFRLSWNPSLQRRSPIPSRQDASPLRQTSTHGHGVSVERCAELLGSSNRDIMLLDVRPYAHFAKGSIRGSLNLCIPTTLLKRPSFDTQKLTNTFTNEADKESFAGWRRCRYIIVYDAATSDMKDASSLMNVLKKFTAEGWSGEGLILLGGFKAFSSRFPTLIQGQQVPVSDSPAGRPSRMHIDLPSVAPVAGGCALPESSHAAIPFFGNIRQHMDLIGGVGQIPLQVPHSFSESKKRLLPPWLREVSESSDKGRKVSEKFLGLEKKELERMKKALSYEKSTDAATINDSSENFRVAGIEKGTKNRYNDIYPFDHSRVRLQNVSPGGCDYVNANHMKAAYSGKHYIATQAPVPDTFNDFWRVVWEQDVRLVVSLTAEVERGHVKCHPYWESGNYGPCQVNNFSQKFIYLDAQDPQPTDMELDKPEDTGSPYIIVRHFGLSHSSFPFQPLREVTQLQYPHWPDFGTTSQPAHLLKLIEQCDKVTAATTGSQPGSCDGRANSRPVLVHCSAGCGRTGTFCTVDSVLDMLKRQRSAAHASGGNMNQCSHTDNVDLIERTVDDFRTQRPSMVQNLSQFVLCYESVLEWTLAQMGKEQDIGGC